MHLLKISLSLVINAILFFEIQGQVSINFSPGRLYYYTPIGKISTQKITLMNKGDKDLELLVSVKDWRYDSLGKNLFFEAGALNNSCANWIKVDPSPYIILRPKEQIIISVTLQPIATTTSIPVRTAIVFFTQVTSETNRLFTSSAKVAVQVGTKIYHSFSDKANCSLEVIDLKDIQKERPPNISSSTSHLELQLLNTGEKWIEGEIETELFSEANGKKIKLDDIPLYSLPGDFRTVNIPLPNLNRGRYTATVLIRSSKKDKGIIAELDFFSE